MRFITAAQIFDGKKFLPKGKILVLDDGDRLLNIADTSETDTGNIENYEGIICPGFVNAHCHLELSYLKGQIEEKKGLLEFAKGIITKRMAFGEEVIKEAALEADKTMWESGIVAVGDISNVPISFDIKKNSPVYYHTFIELIGLNPQHADVVFTFGKDLLNTPKQMGLHGSLVPHAPYSVSPELMHKISSLAGEQELPVSIHNQESTEEDKFFKTKQGGFVELYEFLKLPIDFFKATGFSSLRSYLMHLSNCKKLLLVHNTFTSVEDLEWVNESFEGLYWCLCPNANLYIENALPDVKTMMEKGCRLCIGTDSLASNRELSMISEMNVLLTHFPALKPEQVLEWATSNGAEALGISGKFGSFIKGNNPGLNQLSLQNHQFNFQKKLA
jgi:cytosine/adenosine deaminase-related metal-dependent hydrolase